MWIKFKSGVAGPKITYLPGQVVDHPNAVEARRWLERGTAEEPTAQDIAKARGLDVVSVVETAVPPAAERAVSRPSRQRGGARARPN